MLIRNSQLNELATQRILGRIADIICSTYPDARSALSSDAGRKVLQDQYRKANHYGLSSELDITRYVVTAWLLGADFDTRFPAMREILNDSTRSPDQKAETVEQISIVLLATLKGDPRS